MIQWTDYITFFTSFSSVLEETRLFGVQSIDFVVGNVDDKVKWPTNPPPFILVEIDPFRYNDEGIGGGRWSHTFEATLKVHLIVRNYNDVAWRDTSLLTTTNNLVATYNLVDQIINFLEQSFPTDPAGLLTLVELPYCTSVDAPSRYKESNDLSDICTNFRIKFCEVLPSIMISATPN